MIDCEMEFNTFLFLENELFKTKIKSIRQFSVKLNQFNFDKFNNIDQIIANH